jgi:flagellar protein FlgJ
MQAQALYNDFQTIAGLRSDARRDAEGSLEEVAAQFESLFVQMMLKSMREATEKGGLFNSHQLETYEQMHDQQLSLELSGRGGIGLTEVLVRQLRSSADPAAAPDADAPADFDISPYRLQPFPSPQAVLGPQAPTASAPDKQAVAGTPADFVQRLQPLAEAAAQRLGVDPEVLVAQAALETGWGKHVVSDHSGSSHNLFNIKAGADWRGPTVSVPTLEYRDGVAVRETASFRAYASEAESFADYQALIESSPRYRAALKSAADGEQYLRELQRAGYATDPRYADKVISILDRADLDGTAAALKNSARLPLSA